MAETPNIRLHLARDRSNFDEWIDALGLQYAHLDPVDRKLAIRRQIEVESKRPTINPHLRRQVYERDGHRCLHCGTTKSLSLDHVVPFSQNGQDTFENLQTLCKPCNSRKGASR